LFALLGEYEKWLGLEIRKRLEKKIFSETKSISNLSYPLVFLRGTSQATVALGEY
jgi:hypothetical protein